MEQGKEILKLRTDIARYEKSLESIGELTEEIKNLESKIDKKIVVVAIKKKKIPKEVAEYFYNEGKNLMGNFSKVWENFNHNINKI